MKIIAMYFPQFHAIKENDEWWGKGFTDWHNVRRATYQFEGHYQPRVPLNNNYYDQSSLETLRWQIKLARDHGIYGFCHYHYWFNGVHLLHKPTELVLQNPDLDLPFCLSWANETWSRRWDGLDHHILIQQTHPPEIESWRQHFEYLIRAWKDPRAIRIEGKPVFVIYRPQRITNIDEMLAHWRKWAREEGLPGLYFVFQQQYELPDTACLRSFDAQFQFQPFEAIYSASRTKQYWTKGWINSLLKYAPVAFRNQLNKILFTIKPKQLTFYDYDTVWKNIINIRPHYQRATFPGAFIDWDNTPRYKNRATVFTGASPDKFHYWLSKLADSMPERNLPEDYVFLNAWNEWSEGTYLEPDQKNEYRYLEAVRSVVQR
ncbi:glycoside hydrolase family 99-like domain-containing protein [Methylobacillus flagellatus]|uniref:glycosyltransferase WbsX family protein n=1 Tax=Methylobacillus flagellatus TaxID=405 RepID=UPI002853EB4B|nr:glycoside hydrolase family 99-like domain-containing protein [Methylobacillus flagellatus]MDR5172937.1 glycoside hydrolase family 99-like domain-containing protein [Methylobacillus flagellatus]